LNISHPAQIRIMRGFLLTSLLYLSLPAAQAAEGTQLANLSFAEVDRNHDGAIDAKEAAAVPELAALFRAADKNQDGVLSEQEFKAAAKPMS